MSVKRIRDPAGLLPDIVQVTEIENALPGSAEFEAVDEILRAGDPAARVESLRAHEELSDVADKLAGRLEISKGNADMRLLHDIAQAELRALYLAAASHVIRDRKRQAGTRKERRPDISNWIDAQLAKTPDARTPQLYEQAPDWITDQIGIRRFGARVTQRRKAR